MCNQSTIYIKGWPVQRAYTGMFFSFSESCEYSICCFPQSRKKEKYISRSVYECECEVPTSNSLIHPRPILDQLYFPPLRPPLLPRVRIVDYNDCGGGLLPFILQPPQPALLPARVPLALPPAIPLRFPAPGAAIRAAAVADALRAAAVRHR